MRPDAAHLTPQERQILRQAERAVSQIDGWGDRAEFKYRRQANLWHVTAWRVVHPNASGNERYLPWGSRTLILDDAGKVVEYVGDH